MKMRATALAFTLAFAPVPWLLLPQSALAEEQRIGIVDTTRAAANSKQGKAADKFLKELRERKRSEFRPKDEKLKRLRDEYETQRFVLSKDALQDRELELLKLQRGLERDLEEAQEEFEIEQRKRMQPILKNILKVVNEVARDGGYHVVLERTSPGLHFYSEKLDITDAVIQKLN